MVDQSTTPESLKARREGRFNEAGDCYTISGHERYARSIPNSPQFGAGLLQLQRAALCYELADSPDRRVNRCRQGVLIAEDVLDRVFATDPDHPIDRARRGVWYEHVGDFRLIGEFDDPSPAYDDAIEVYQDAGDPDTFSAEQEQFPLMEHLVGLADAVGRDVGPIDTPDNDMTMSDWVGLKREVYPELIEALYEQGEWP